MRKDNQELKEQLEKMLSPKKRTKQVNEDSELGRVVAALKGNPFASNKKLYYIIEGYRVDYK